jgi:hypothetical protein
MFKMVSVPHQVSLYTVVETLNIYAQLSKNTLITPLATDSEAAFELSHRRLLKRLQRESGNN